MAFPVFFSRNLIRTTNTFFILLQLTFSLIVLQYQFFFFFFFCLLSFVVVVAISWAAPAAYGGSQARG